MRVFRLGLQAVVFMSFAFPLPAAEGQDSAKLRLPWETLQKLLKLGGDEVRLSWSEFQTLLRHTGVQKTPAYSVVQGEVVLSSAEFTRLVQSLQPPPPAASKSYITRAVYDAGLSGDSVRVQAALRLSLRETVKPLRLDVFPTQAAFEEILLDGRPALAERENGRLFVTVSGPGDHDLRLTYVVRAPQARAAQEFSLSLIRTPITEFRAEIPERYLDIEVSPALQREIFGTARGTRARALLPTTEYVTVRWHPRIPDEAKGPAKVYAESRHLLSIEDDALRVQSRLDLQVMQNNVSRVVLEVPSGFTVIRVTGQDLGEWTERPGKPALLEIPFTYARQGNIALDVTLERLLNEGKNTLSFTGLPVRGALRDRGALAVELLTSAEIPKPRLENLDRVDVQELPVEFVTRSERPLLFAFKFLRPPFSLSLDVEPHRDVGLVSSVIDAGEGTTLLLPDGKRLHRVLYQVKNRERQFLEVQLPADAQLWSAFVSGQPVKPSLSEKKRVLIPLLSAGGSLRRAFLPVEVVFYQETPRYSLLGRPILEFPVPDMVTSRLRWTLYTPKTHRFAYLGRRWERERPVPISLFENKADEHFALRGALSSDRRNAGRFRSMVGSKLKSVPAMSAPMEVQGTQTSKSEVVGAGWTDNEGAACGVPESPAPSGGAGGQDKEIGRLEGLADRVSAVSGVLPIRIDVPALGTPLTFTQDLPESGTLQPLPLWTAKTGLIAALKILAGILALLGLVRFRARWIPPVQNLWVKVRPHLPGLGPLLTPTGSLFAAAVAALLASYPGGLLFFLAVLGFWAAVTRWIFRLLNEGDAS